MKKLFLFVFSVLMMSCDFSYLDEKAEVKSLSFEQPSLTLQVSQSVTCRVNISPSGIKDARVEYSVSQQGVVFLSEASSAGVVVTAVGEGTAIVIAECSGFVAYLEVRVEGSSIKDPYIVLPYVTMNLDKGSRRTVLASVFGGNPASSSAFTWSSSSDCVNIDSIGSSCSITAVKEGIARITVSHPDAFYDASFLVIVPSSSVRLCYLTTSSNVLKLSLSGTEAQIVPSIFGGAQGDENKMMFEITEGNDVISISSSGSRASVKPLKEGQAVVRISHEKAPEALYVKVLVTSGKTYSFIKPEKNFLILEDSLWHEVRCSFFGECEDDFLSFYSCKSEDEDTVEAYMNLDTLKIRALKEGRSRITISNKYASADVSIEVIASSSKNVSTLRYISVKTSIIRLEEGGDAFDLDYSLEGGNEADKNNFSFTVSDSSVFKVESPYGTVSSRTLVYSQNFTGSLSLIPVHPGKAELEIFHPKSESSCRVQVIVYPKGIMKKNEVTVTCPSYIQGEVGKDQEVLLQYVKGNAHSVTEVSWTSTDEDIVSVVGSKDRCILTFKSEGYADITCSSPDFSSSVTFSCISISQGSKKNILYCSERNISLMEGTSEYIALKTLQETSDDCVNVSVSSPDVITCSVFPSVLKITALKPGKSLIHVSHPEIEGYVLTLTVEVFSSLSLECPYVLETVSCVNLTEGSETEVECTLKNAPAGMADGISVSSSSPAISVSGSGTSLRIKGLQAGDAWITVSHPLCAHEARIFVHCVKTETDLAKAVLYSPKTSYYVQEGEDFFIEVFSSLDEIPENLEWSVSDIEKVNIEPFSNGAYIAAVKEGFTDIVCSAGDVSLKFFITVVKQKESSSYVTLPSVMELQEGKTGMLEASVSGFSAAEIAMFEWKVSGDAVTINAAEKTCHVMAEREGVSFITLTLPDGKVHSVTVAVFSAEVSECPCVIGLSHSFFRMNKGSENMISIEYGTYPLNESLKKNFIWKSSDEQVCEVYPDGDRACIKAAGEGRCTVRIENPFCVNYLEFTVEVYSQELLYTFSIPSVITMIQGTSLTQKYFLYNSSAMDLTLQYEAEAVSDDESIVEVSCVDGLLRLNALSEGKTFIRLRSSFCDAAADVLCIVAKDEAGLENAAFLEVPKDHYLLEEGASAVISVLSSGEDITAVYDDELLSVEKSGKTFLVKALREGNARIIFSSGKLSCTVHIGISRKVYQQSGSIACESIINIVKGKNYVTHPLCSSTVSAVFGSREIYSCDVDDTGDFILCGLKEGSDVLVLYSGSEERTVIVNVFSDEASLKNYQGMSVTSRKINLSCGEEYELQIQYFNSAALASFTQYEDVYENNVISLENNEGKLKVQALNEGIARIKVSNPYLNSFEVYFTVHSAAEKIMPSASDFYLYADETYISLDPSSSHVLYCYADRTSSFSAGDDYKWTVSKENVISLEPHGNTAVIKPLTADGKCTVICSNIKAANTVCYVITVGIPYEREGKQIPYISCSSSTVAMDYASGSVTVAVRLINMDSSSLSSLQVQDLNEGITAIETEYLDDILNLTFTPLSCGHGQIKLSHSQADYDAYIDYIVNDSLDSSLTYLTTSSNAVNVRPGEYRTLTSILKNASEMDAADFRWKIISGNDNIALLGSGREIQVYGIKEGKAQIVLSHPLSLNTLSFTVFVSSSAAVSSYITTASNIIEAKVSPVLESFNVTVVGSVSETHKLKYTVSDPEILSVIGSGTTCYYRALKSGNVRITVSDENDSSCIPLEITVIAEEIPESKGYLSVSDSVLYLEPSGSSKTLTAAINGLSSYDESRLEWYIYSQSLSFSGQGNVITLASSGSRALIKPENEGIAKIRILYPPENLKLNVMIYVSSCGRVEFEESSVSIEKGDSIFTAVNVPSFSQDILSCISYVSDNPDVCNVFGTGKACCITAVSPGSTIVRIKNSYDDTQDEIAVHVTEASSSAVRIAVSQNCYLLNPRSASRTITASLLGNNLPADAGENLEWSVSGSSCISLYPLKGSETVLSLIKEDGIVKEGSAIITVTHPECPEGYKKTIYVSVEEIQNYFTLDKTAVTVDADATCQVTASIAGSSYSDLEEIEWSITDQKIEADGSITQIARVLTPNGKTCTLMGLTEGKCTLTCSYKGDILQCSVTVRGDRYFTLVNNSLTLFPGQEYTLPYNLRPASYTPIWYSSDAYGDEKYISYSMDNDSQKLKIKALKEGNVTLTGMVAGIGTVICNIKIVYSPQLLDKSKSLGTVFIPLYDRGTSLFEKTHNSKQIQFKCYPSIYYVKATVEGPQEFKDCIDVTVQENHENDQELASAGIGTITVNVNRELPDHKMKIVLEQFKDKDLQETTGNKIKYELNSYYVDEKGDRDDSFMLLFKRYDGGMTFKGKPYDYFEDGNGYIKIMDTKNGIIKKDSKTGKLYAPSAVTWGDGETHDFIFRPAHEGQYIKDLKISVKLEQIPADMTCSGYKVEALKLACSPFNMDKGNYVSVVTTGKNNDVGFDCMYDKEKNVLCIPEKSSDTFYSRFCVDQIKWVNDSLKTECYPLGKDGMKLSSLIINNNGQDEAFYESNAGENSEQGGKESGESEVIEEVTQSDYQSGHLKVLSNGIVLNNFYFSSDCCNSKSTTCNQEFMTVNDVITLFDYRDHDKSADRHHYLYTEEQPDETKEFPLLYNLSKTGKKHKKDNGDWHYKREGKSSMLRFYSEFTGSSVIYEKDNFPFNEKLFFDNGKNEDLNMNYWKEEAWIDSGHGRCYPNCNENPEETITGEMCLSFKNLTGETFIYYIPVTLNLYDMYKGYYQYDDKGYILDKRNEKANPVFRTLK